MGETQSDYFVAGGQRAVSQYAVEGQSLKDTPGIRRDLANLFKSAYMPEQARIDFDKWLSLARQGYCYPPVLGASGGDDTAMAIDFITDNGLIAGVVVGSVGSCQGEKVGRGLGNDTPPAKSEKKTGGGC